MIRDKLCAQLRIDEGVRNKLYQDTVGKWTGGVGRNFSDRQMSPALIQFMLDEDIDMCIDQLDHAFPWWEKMCDARQNALLNLVFNLGITTLLQFKNSLAALEAGKWEAAANGFMDSKWAKQVGARAVRVTDLIRNGYFP